MILYLVVRVQKELVSVCTFEDKALVLYVNNILTVGIVFE